VPDHIQLLLYAAATVLIAVVADNVGVFTINDQGASIFAADYVALSVGGHCEGEDCNKKSSTYAEDAAEVDLVLHF
jgi:hypothetical protein